MGKLDTVEVNGPEEEVLDWDAVDWHRVEDDVRRLRQRIFTAACLSRLPGKRARPVVCPTHGYVEDHPAESGFPLLRWGFTDRAFHMISSLRGTRGVRRVAGIYWAWLLVARSARSLAR
jgi:hypothetical protein